MPEIQSPLVTTAEERFNDTMNCSTPPGPLPCGTRGSVLQFAICLALGLVASAPAQPVKYDPGLLVTYRDASAHVADTDTVPNVRLHVAPGEAPTPFLPGGQFSATWEGAISADLRGTFFFQAELNGTFKLEINGAPVIETTGTGGASPLSNAVRLNKGTNAFKATFTSPARGDAFVRLGWTEKGTLTTPIPAAAFSHAPTPALRTASQLRLGRELFLELRCAKCHATPVTTASVPELTMDAPAFEGIGARRKFDWMARWILDPKALRPAAHMPKLLRGTNAQPDAEAMAAYLASLQTGGTVTLAATSYATRQSPAQDGDEPVPAAKPLYERLRCDACHNPPNATEPDPKKLSQKRVAEKFPPGKLAEFLRAPEAHYAWTRMPNFHLTAKEAKELEDWLFAAAPKPPAVAAPADAAIIARGQKLVQTSGCLNCHNLKLENQFRNPPSDILFSRHLKDRPKLPAGDCLGSTPAADYQLSAEQRAALNAFTETGPASLTRHVPAEFAGRQTRTLNCAACHGPIELVPPLEILGGKLKPEWAAKFLAGEIPHKMRYDDHPRGEPWVDARMPAFKSRATWLAAGMAAQHGVPPRTPPEPPVDRKLAELGRQLTGKDGGFSCVSCHAVGPQPAREVFDSEGINLADSAARLLPDYYRRWFRNPVAIDPQTKMPVYFDEGRSPLTEILEGDAERQMDALWHYLRFGAEMPAPGGPQ